MSKCPRRAIRSATLVKQRPWKSVVFAMQQADPVKSAAALGFPGSECSALSGSGCYTRSNSTSPYCQLRRKLQCRRLQQLQQLPFTSNFDSSSLSLCSVRLLGMRQHVLQPFIFHLDIGMVKESLHYQCHSRWRERKETQQENMKLPKIYKVNLGLKSKFWILSSRWL